MHLRLFGNKGPAGTGTVGIWTVGLTVDLVVNRGVVEGAGFTSAMLRVALIDLYIDFSIIGFAKFAVYFGHTN